MSKNMAIIDNDKKVINIIRCRDEESETDNLITYSDQNPAYIEGDFVEGFFYPPQPFPSWIRSQGTWIPPVPKPESEGRWFWDEQAQEWQD